MENVKNLTPMMQQYAAIKSNHNDALLFYRMGDFYELFFEDALIAAHELSITLTKRGKTDFTDIPMCGVPLSSYQSYLAKLIGKGFKVAICDQVETPQQATQRGKKSLLKREVVRIVTQGTLYEDELINSGNYNYLIALEISEENDVVGLCLADVSTGFLSLEHSSLSDLSSVLARYQPKEIILSDQFKKKISNFNHGEPEFFASLRSSYYKNITFVEAARFQLESAQERVRKFYKIHSVEIFGELSSWAQKALGALIDYLYLTQKDFLPRLRAPKFLSNNDVLHIDRSTRRNLEIDVSQSGDSKNSLIDIIDCTLTNLGKRLLRQHFSRPTTNVHVLNKRLDFIDFFLAHSSCREYCMQVLSECSDGERAFIRLTTSKGNPKDLIIIQKTLSCGINILDYFEKETPEIIAPSHLLIGWKERLTAIKEIYQHLSTILDDSHISTQTTTSSFVKNGFDYEIDTLDHFIKNHNNLISELEKKYVLLTKIKHLKIRHNNLIGYYIELNNSHLKNVPDYFIQRQSLSTGARFTTSELVDLEQKIQTALDKKIQRTEIIFKSLVNALLEKEIQLRDAFEVIATIDVACSSALQAHNYNYTRPIFTTKNSIDIHEGRHPMIERSLLVNKEARFISNNCVMSDENNVFILTGPNMGGKSTYLRQNALIIFMAQVGLFVPANYCCLGPIDRLCSRIGAHDDITTGRSTFMVEMLETASILHQATHNSFVILDEVGRGTSHDDGLAIATAVIEYLHDHLKCHTLFATHYHEIFDLTQSLKRCTFLTPETKSIDNTVLFTHKIVSGSTKNSYGLMVAEKAGLPSIVLKRSREFTEIFSKNKEVSPLITKCASIQKEDNDIPSIKNRILSLDLDSFSAKDALDELYSLKYSIS